ncbi:MAG: DegV family EDD domain-containing protein [Deltaproteobacteria bacterium]|nr:DegV family EDD domain-containing protein [Deltaproteobacteria bacterium]
MKPDFQKAHISGVERIAAWSDVLDDINVYPVADGDTGRNLITSLTPLRYLQKDPEDTTHKLLLSARGNSGNIAVRFFTEFLTADSYKLLSQAAKSGRDQAWQAVSNPIPGTMLTVLDALVDFLEKNDFEAKVEYVAGLIDKLEKAVKSTPELLPKLKQAGVVDSGALGMYIFLEGFFKSLIGRANEFQPIMAIFDGTLEISSSFQEKMTGGFCVDTVLQFDSNATEKISQLSRYGESVVVIPHKDYLKVHFHTGDAQKAKAQMENLGEVVHWTDDNLAAQVKEFRKPRRQGAIHIMTDAAGSVTREDSHELGITLLDSYIIAGEKSLPETLFTPDQLYQTMRRGVKVSTSQASVFERHQYYQRLINQYQHVLYLCVGSVFTGNYAVAVEWKQKNDPDDRLTVIDTTAASGRLGTIVLATARYSFNTIKPNAVIDFAKRAIHKCREYVFLDKLKYLAAGGRLSKSSAFFGDVLHVKPIISPTAEGAKKVGAVKNRDGQLKFALDKLEESFDKNSSPFIMLEYSDNRNWVNDTVKTTLEKHYPSSEIILQPLSLTSGVHMGPGTWALAYLPENV